MKQRIKKKQRSQQATFCKDQPMTFFLTLAKLKQRESANKIRNEKEDHSTDTTEI